VAERKKVLFIVEAMGGGVFTYIVDLANQLANMTDAWDATTSITDDKQNTDNTGRTDKSIKESKNNSNNNNPYIYEMYVAYGIRKQTPKDYKRYFDKKIHLIQVESFGRSISLIKDFKAFFEIKKIASEVQPDIIHLHSSKAGALGRVAFNGLKIAGKPVPVFYTPHGYSFLMKNHSAPKRLIYKLIEQGCGKLDCTTISCSAGEHQETLKLTRRATYVNNGINTRQLERSLGKLKIENHPFTVFTLGRICYQKNPALFNQIAEAMPDVRFLWIGDGELRDELTSENIEITGWVDRKTALTKSMSADVFVLPSLWEGLPISLLEAMYMKKPCAVSDVIGNHDVIHNRKNGFVCEDSNSFVDAIRSIQRDMSGQAFEAAAGAASVYPKAVVTGESKKLVERAYADVMEKYNTTVMAREYSRIYCGGH